MGGHLRGQLGLRRGLLADESALDAASTLGKNKFPPAPVGDNDRGSLSLAPHRELRGAAAFALA